MKSERRHELKTNSLSLILLDLPGTIRENATNILLFVFVVLCGVALYYYRTSSAQQATSAAVEGISVARDSIIELQHLPAYDPDFYGHRRQQLAADAATSISQILTAARDPHAQAEALVAKGDLNWTLANSPEFPGATTRPYLKTDSPPSEYLKEAAGAYDEVLAKYSDQRDSVIAAKFGLAAIAENQHKWDDAKTQYESLLADANLTAAYHDFAQMRLADLPELAKPARIGNPTTAPAIMQIAPPTSAPTTKTSPLG